MEQFHHLGTVSVREDHKAGKWYRSRVCLYDKFAACSLTVTASVTLSRSKVAHWRDKIAR